MPLIPYFIDCPRCGFEGAARPFLRLPVLQKIALLGFGFAGCYLFYMGCLPFQPLWVAAVGLLFLLGTVLYARVNYVAECPACRALVWNFFWFNHEV